MIYFLNHNNNNRPGNNSKYRSNRFHGLYFISSRNVKSFNFVKESTRDKQIGSDRKNKLFFNNTGIVIQHPIKLGTYFTINKVSSAKFEQFKLFKVKFTLCNKNY